LSTDTGSIYVLTDTPEAYGEALNHAGMLPVFAKDIESLLAKLRNVAMAGLVLELSKVMKASRKDRDRLFNYAGTFPVLRTKVDSLHGFVSYLDSKECFFRNLDAAIGKRCRSHERVSVRLECAFSVEDDPIMLQTTEGIIFDISPGGCFMNTHRPTKSESFIHLRIPGLENSRPIFSSIRWSRAEEVDGALPGMGIMFIDLSDDQLENIAALQLGVSAE